MSFVKGKHYPNVDGFLLAGIFIVSLATEAY